jgi:hypothetical protein
LLEAQRRRLETRRKEEDDKYTANKEAERKRNEEFVRANRAAQIALHGSHNGPIEITSTERFHG